MKAFAYSSARSVKEAVGLLGDGTRALAGGTDLLTLMKAELAAPERLVDIKHAAGLSRGIEESPEGLAIGALATLDALARDETILRRYRALAQAAQAAATPQLRNMATLGGNLLQRPRCWYFRSPHIDCWLKGKQGGEPCPAREGENRQHALFGGGPCHAVHPSDPASALLALDAAVRVQGADSERQIALAEFFALPSAERRTETTLREGELIVSVRLPRPAAETRSTYLKAMDRKFWAFALVSVAVALGFGDGRIGEARVVLGGVAPIPWRAFAAEQVLAGAEPGEALFERAAEAALSGAVPLRQNGYKLGLARALIKQALRDLTGQP